MSVQGDVAALTEDGVSYARTVPVEASEKLLEGRSAVRKAIKMLSGHDLQEDDYRRVWDVLQDSVAELFYSHGAAIVRMVGALITGERGEPKETERALLVRLGDRVGALFASPAQRDEVRQAVIDMFSEKGAAAFDWLTDVCGMYVMMCSLGFENLSAGEITKLLRSFELVPDSDIVLSLLCIGEHNHDAVKRIINGWRALGGTLHAASPVMEEVAHHAVIADVEYNVIGDQLGSLTDEEAERLIGNAFVRTFRKVSAGKLSRRSWSQYIGEYQGSDEWDYSVIFEILAEEFGFKALEDVAERDSDFAKAVAESLIKHHCQELNCERDDLDRRRIDKCRRDGWLLALVKGSRKAKRKSRSPGTTMVLSSSKLLKDADEAFRAELGGPDAVVSMAALGALLTLTPGVRMGVGTLREVLFDMGLIGRLTPLQRFAYRIIRTSGEFDLPWSRRVTLQRTLTDRLLVDAGRRGEPFASVKKRVLRGKDPQYSATVVADALKAMAVPPRVRTELQEKDKLIRYLQLEVEKLRDALEADEQESEQAMSKDPRAGDARFRPKKKPRRR